MGRLHEADTGVSLVGIEDRLSQADAIDTNGVKFVEEAAEATRRMLHAMWKACADAGEEGLPGVTRVQEDTYANAFRIEDPRFFRRVQDRSDASNRLLRGIGKFDYVSGGAYVTLHSDHFDPEDPRDQAEKLYVSVQVRNHVGRAWTKKPEDYVPDIGVAFHQRPEINHRAEYRPYFNGPPHKSLEISELSSRVYSPLDVTRAMLYTVSRLGNKIPVSATASSSV